MNYSLEKIGTVATCDTLLVQARQKKQSLERKRRNLGEAIDAFRKQMNEIGPDLALTRSMLDTFTTASAAMPEGKDKMKTVIKVRQLEARHAVLEQKTRRYHVHALLAKELAFMKLDSQVSVMERYIDAVETLRAALGNPVLPLRQTPVVTKSEAGVAAKTEKVIPEAAAWKTVVEAYLNTAAAPSPMVLRRVAAPVDDPLFNTPVRRTGRTAGPPAMVRAHRIMPSSTAADIIGDDHRLAYSA